MNASYGAKIVTADIYDLHHDKVRVCELQLRSFGKVEAFFGPCSTVSTYEDHTPVLRALEEKGGGRVLVVDAGGSLRVGVMGDRLAMIGARNGWIGVVINGAIRDSRAIDELDLGVKALGATARRGWVPCASKRDIAIEIGAVRFDPGNWVYADRDSVIVSDDKLDLRKSDMAE